MAGISEARTARAQQPFHPLNRFVDHTAGPADANWSPAQLCLAAAMWRRANYVCMPRVLHAALETDSAALPILTV
jgi:hypothetical protein